MTHESEMECEATDESAPIVLMSAVMIFTMQYGFALLEASAVRSTNLVSIFTKNIMDLAISVVAFQATGFALFDGKSMGGVMGTEGFFTPVVRHPISWIFHLSFAATAATIDSGCCAERLKLSVYLGLSFFMSAFIYPVVAHWVWHPEGWLYAIGYIDLAGASAVHLLGGTSALVCTKVLGPRIGRMGMPVPKELKCVEQTLTMSHSAFQGEAFYGLLGAIMIAVAWICFNGASFVMPSDRPIDYHSGVASVMGTTLISGSWGLLAAAAFAAKMRGKLPPADLATGLLAGLVSVTGCADIVGVHEAAVLGLVGGTISFWATKLMLRIKIDDPVGVLSVHFFPGIWGCIAPALFGHKMPCSGADVGLFFGGGGGQLGIQVLGGLSIIFWSGLLTYMYFKLVQLFMKGKIRVAPMTEILGIDAMEHGVDAYRKMKMMETLQHELRLMTGQFKGTSQPTAAVVPLDETDQGDDSSVHKLVQNYVTSGTQALTSPQGTTNNGTTLLTTNSPVLQRPPSDEMPMSMVAGTQVFEEAYGGQV